MIARAVPALLAALLLLATVDVASGAVDPHPRDTPAMSMGTAVTAMAMSSSSGHILAGRADPGRQIGQTATETVWRLWDAGGNQVSEGRADEAGCNTITLFDACIGDVVDVAISANGARFVVIARGNSATEGRILFLHQAGGALTTVLNRELSAEAPTVVAMNGDGTQVVVGTDRGGSPATGRVRAYDWSTTTSVGTVSDAWDTATATAITSLALGNDRVTVAAGGLNTYRLTTTGVLTTDTSPSENGAPVAAVAIGRVHPDHWAAATTNSGELLLSNDAQATQPQRIVAGTSPKRAVAMTNDNLLVATGDDAGAVRLFQNCNLVTSACSYDLQTTVTVGGAVTSLAFSQDGRYLAVGTQQGTSLLRVASQTLATTWTHATGAVVEVAAGSTASTVAAASGSAVTAFTTVRSATLSVVGNGVVQPGATGQATVTVVNTGNREDTFTVDAPAFPSGWTGAVSRNSLTLAPDASGTFLLNVSVPLDAAPGSAKVPVTVRVAGAPKVLDVAFTVAQAHRWLLGHEGAVSVNVAAGGSVTFPFRATNIGNGADTTRVTYSVDRTGWTATVVPDTLSAAPGQAAWGNVTLTAPADARQLDSTAVTLGLEQDPATSLRLTGTIGARFGVSADADPATSDATPGRATTFLVHVRNTGNAPDTFVVLLSGLPSGWQPTAIPGKTPVVASGATADVTIQVTVPADAKPGDHELDIRVESQGDNTRTATTHHVFHLEDDSQSETSTTKKGSKGSPGPALPLLALALVALALARRR